MNKLARKNLKLLTIASIVLLIFLIGVPVALALEL